jgi:hypothetical protein
MLLRRFGFRFLSSSSGRGGGNRGGGNNSGGSGSSGNADPPAPVPASSAAAPVKPPKHAVGKRDDGPVDDTSEGDGSDVSDGDEYNGGWDRSSQYGYGMGIQRTGVGDLTTWSQADLPK